MYFYIDESGSMTHETSSNKNKFFIIAIVLVNNPDKLRRIYKRFISKYSSVLKKIDIEGKMFNNDKFIELKGSALTSDMKKNFVSYFCRNNHFQLLYIKVDNSMAHDNLYRNKARAFNYILKLALEYLSNRQLIDSRNWILNIDERNIKTEAKHQLREFLSTDFSTGKNIVDDISVTYFDSSNNKIIQLADVFANILYSNILTNGSYENEIKFMADNGYLINTFEFPLM